ncbi:MAG: MarR family transcriptional regulator [Deltaproteobacteria bacterium]|nr:MarR family transcriptional regulator [Deltaproteobacteria bacterium]
MDFISPQECPYFLVTRAGLAVTSALKKGFAEAGIENVRPAYMGALMTLWEEDGQKVVDLARGAGLEPSTMTGLLDRMERDGLVKREADPEDRRVLRIFLTEQAKGAWPVVMRVALSVVAEAFSGIEPERLEVVKDVLRTVLKNAHEEKCSCCDVGRLSSVFRSLKNAHEENDK